MRQFLSDFQTVHYINFFYKISCKISFQYYLKLVFFMFLQLKKIKSLLTVWYALRSSQQPTVSLNYSQSIKINSAPSNGGTIIMATHRPTVLYWRLSEFCYLIRFPFLTDYLRQRNWIACQFLRRKKWEHK